MSRTITPLPPPRPCEYCGALLERKRYASGLLETRQNFATRRHCSTTCHDAAKTVPAIQRFLSRIEKNERGCWLWTGYIAKNGYGQLTDDRNRTVRVHRWGYERLVGPLSAEVHLDHLCRVRHCVNPEHLDPVTPAENVLRGIGLSAENAKKTHCKRGHPLSGDNLIIFGAKGYRNCRICKAAKTRESNARRQAVAR